MTEKNGVERSTATDVLRRMLDERGVEYFKHEDGEPLRKLEKADEPATSWHMGGASVCAVPIEGSDLFDLWIDHCTPEQAIAATLGATDAKPTQEESSGTCYPIISDNLNESEGMGDAWADCSECGHLLFVLTDPNSEPPKYCPNCGRRCVG